MKQMNLLLERIDVRLHNDYATNAALHGQKVKMRSLRGSINNVAEMSEAQKNKVNEALKRKQEEMKRELSNEQ